MKLAFIWLWEHASKIYPKWRDGLRGALEEISKEHEVIFFLDGALPQDYHDWDAILFWDDSNSAFFHVIDRYPCKKGMILTTDPHNIENLKKVDIVFCESQPIYEAVRRHGLRAVKAFGTDTDFYKPHLTLKKDIEYFYPATFSPWKRQDTIAHLGKKLFCLGTVQPDGQEIYKKCLKMGVQCLVGYFPAEKVREYYQRAKKVIIPAIHGSERTVLEAMALNILPEINPQNQRASSYLKEYRETKEYITPRDFIRGEYSHKKYAEKILKAYG